MYIIIIIIIILDVCVCVCKIGWFYAKRFLSYKSRSLCDDERRRTTADGGRGNRQKRRCGVSPKMGDN